MGALFKFVCNGCGYAAEVSGGGDAGMETVTLTIVCEECRTIRDVVVAKMNEDGAFNEIPPRCPRGRKHTVRGWTEACPCPRCGGTMNNTGLAAIRD